MKKALAAAIICIGVVMFAPEAASADGNPASLEWQGPFTFSLVHNAERNVPEYAKWGNLAMREASKKGYQILDYKYVGKQKINPTVTEQIFKFWVKKAGKPMGLYVSLRYETATERVLNIDYRETAR
ncbi:Uncharacterised protein [Chlamydia abortus]|uniref:DUF3889 domain-containing protein n=1 Tax=Paenibacillus sp. 32O-W TaxID=1695218 RepID=UPI000A27D717|nr:MULTISPECIES: DUF3889 domain-containing protein [Paenibacillaceae]SHE09714.1 Uncharacterised protein [Chlamydia abortus]